MGRNGELAHENEIADDELNGYEEHEQLADDPT